MTANKLYETTFIVDGNLDDDTIKAIVEKVTTTLTTLGAEVKSVSELGRKKLAYPIGKAVNGAYTHIEFVCDGAMLKELERQYRLNEQILRFLTIILDKRLLEMRERVLKYGTAPVVAPEEVKPA